jgi:hypothetical protein
MKCIRGAVLIVLATAALAAIPATAAASGGFVADSYPATVQGSQVGIGGLAVGSHSAECSSMSFGASLNHPSPGAGTSSVKDPTCKNGSLEMKGCQFEFHPGSGTVGIGPSGCGPVRASIASCSGVPMYVPAQGGIATKYENTGSGSEAGVIVTVSDSDVEYTTTNNPCNGTGTFKDLAVALTFKITATDAGKKAIGISVVSGDVPIGLSLAGGPEAGEPRLTAPEYPVHVTGERFHVGEENNGQITLWEIPGKKMSCDVAQLDGGVFSGPAYGGFSLNAGYSKCSLNSGSVSATVSMNSCHYLYSNLEQVVKDEYKGVSSIVCSGSDVIKIAMTACTLEIPGQTLSGPLSLINLFDGGGFSAWDAEVAALMSGTGVKYTISGGFCSLFGLKKGTAEDGSVHSDMILHGIYPG